MRPRRNHPESRVLGFDPSKGRVRGVADDTAIVAIRVEDAAVEVLGHWSQPEDSPGWEAPRAQIAERLGELLADELTVGMRTDAAAGWAGQVATWEREFGGVLWTPHLRLAGTWLVKAWDDLYDAIAAGQIAVDFELYPELREHLLGAKNRGPTVGKDHRGPTAPKIDLAAALAYAYRSLLDARAHAPKRSSGRGMFV